VIAGASRGCVMDCRPHGYDRGNSVLENQLLLIVGFEHERILIETLDAAGEFHAAQEINSNHSLFFTRIIEKTVLYVLRWFVHLDPCPEKNRSL
jgi:hypothetical protein